MQPDARFVVGDMVRTPMGRVATVTRIMYDGRLELEYVGNKAPMHPDGMMVLDPRIVERYER